LAAGTGGEIESVSHAFQPDGRQWPGPGRLLLHRSRAP